MEPTKENVQSCNRLLERFQGLRFFNTLSVLSLQIIHEALLNAARDRDQAEQIVNAWIAEHSEYPTAADINQIARELNRNQSGAVTLPPPCAECQEIPGYRRMEIIVKVGHFAGEMRSALRLCTCPRGIALQEAALRERSRERTAVPDFTRVGEIIE